MALLFLVMEIVNCLPAKLKFDGTLLFHDLWTSLWWTHLSQDEGWGW